MKKYFFLCFFSLAFFSKEFAQDWKWDTLTNEKWRIRLCTDQEFNIYTFCENDTILSKYNAKGKLLWSKHFPGNFRIKSVSCSQDSSIYVLGIFENTLSIGNQYVVSKGLADVFIACIFKSSGLK